MSAVRSLLLGDGPRFGSIIQVPDPLVVEAYAQAGFDFVILDQEHGAISARRLGDLVRAAEAGGVIPVVRVAENRPSLIGFALDQGARGIVVPGIRSPDEARAAAEAARYPPEGRRGYCSAVRGAGILPDPAAAARANQEVCVLVLVETLEAVEAAGEIARLPGVDVLFVGLGDLSAAVGAAGQLGHPEVARAVARVTECARAAGKALAVHVRDVEAAVSYLEQGFRLISYGIDVQILALRLRDIAIRLRHHASQSGSDDEPAGWNASPRWRGESAARD